MTREEMLRASGLAALGVALGGCSLTGGNGKDPAFATHGGDAWTWQKTLGGDAAGCKDVTVRANGKAAKAVTSGATWRADVALAPGDNRIEAACGDGSGSTVTYRQRLAERPTARAVVTAAGRDGITLDGSTSDATRPTGSGIATYAWAERPGNPEPLKLSATDSATVRAEAPAAPGEYYITLDVTDGDGNADRSTTYFVVDGGGPRTVDLAHEAPAWIDSAIVYGVIPFLFGDEPFPAITKRLPYLADLGVNALWISPVTVPALGDFGYAVVDYFKPNPDYGTEDDFRTLVQTAHDNGIRVLIDFIPNHSSDEHPYFKDAQKHHKRSPYWTFYDRDDQGEYTYYFDWENLPNFNYSNPEVRTHMTEAFAHWVREFDVDGFRVDACWGVRRRYPQYWKEWREEMKRIKPDMLLIAEATALDPWYYENGFDVGYDWTKDLGKWAWQDVFYDTPSVAESLDYALSADPRPGRVFHFLNNNDTGPRFISTYDSDTTRVAAALLLTLPGVPCVYTGDEVGAAYEPYSDHTPIDWDDTYGLRPWYHKLCHLRTATPSLHSQEWTKVPVRPERSGLYAYLRHGQGKSDPVLVLLNFARDVFTAQLDIPSGFDSVSGASSLRDVLNDRTVEVSGGKIHIDALDAMVLRPGSAA